MNGDFIAGAMFGSLINLDEFNHLELMLKNTFLKHVDDSLYTPYPAILASDYMKYSKTGNRTDFEDIYFKRRNMLSDFILGQLINPNDLYLSRIIDGIFLLCEESGWQLPPHNSYNDGYGNQSLPDITRPVLDLFSCETGAFLAFTGYLLDDALDKVSPFIRERINTEVVNRLLMPYYNSFVWWMGNGKDKTCNWTPWCTQNILIATICSQLPKEIKQSIYQKAIKSLTYFMDDYGQDGCCEEGALYYRHAGLCLWLSLELLQSQGIIVDYIMNQKDKLKNIAEYIFNVHVENEYYINYADCSSKPGPCTIREYLFGKMVNSTALINLAANDITRDTSLDTVILPTEINLFYRCLSLTKYNEILGLVPNAVENIALKNVWYPSTELGISRGTRCVLSVKGGNNNESHNHNDVGSLTLYIDGRPCLIDLGVESYTAKTFSADRYSIWTMQSSYHNLPDINGLSELPGPDYKAADTVCTYNDETFHITTELSGAYDKKAMLSSFKRSISFIKTENEAISINDCFIFNNEDCKSNQVIENFMTCEKPYFDNNILHIGNLATINISSSYTECNIEEIPVTDKRLSGSYAGYVYRIRIKLDAYDFSAVIKPI